MDGMVNDVGWKCNTCGEGSNSDNLNWPIRHRMDHPDHEVEPTVGTAVRWGRAMGMVE